MAIIQERYLFGRQTSRRELQPGTKVRLRINTGLTLSPLGSEKVIVDSPRSVIIKVGSTHYHKGFLSSLAGERINEKGLESSGRLSHLGVRKRIIFQEDK